MAAAGGDAEALSAGSPYSTPWRPGPCTERPEPSARTLLEGPRGAAAAVGATQTDKELSVGSPPRPFLSVSAKQPLEEPRPRPRPPPLLRCCAFSVLNTSARRASGPEGPGDRRGRGRAPRSRGTLQQEDPRFLHTLVSRANLATALVWGAFPSWANTHRMRFATPNSWPDQPCCGPRSRARAARALDTRTRPDQR